MSLILSLVRTSLGKKYIVASTGFLLGLFLFAHLVDNAGSFFGGDAYNAYAAHLHSLGLFLRGPETILFLIFAVHASTALLLFVENRKARPCRYAVSLPVTVKVNSATMPYTGAVILVFVLVHLFHFHFANGTAMVSFLARETLSRPAGGLFYVFALTALGLHLSHGFWSLLQSFGINHPRYNDFFVLAGLGGGVFISAGFMLIVFFSLFSGSFLL